MCAFHAVKAYREEKRMSSISEFARKEEEALGLNKPNHPMIGIGGAPTRATVLPEEAKARKQYPVASGLLDYFPDALAVVSNVSWNGNEQHNPGQPLHWARSKSADEADTMMRHFLQRGTVDTDGIRHSAKMAWRALALLQKEIEEEQKA
jgi:dATP/dGTP diphosphohydrolase